MSRVLGFMSGTSLDGVDAAIIDTDGERVSGFGPATLAAFADADRQALVQATTDAIANDGEGAPPSFVEATEVIHRTHLRAFVTLMEDPDAGRVDLIAFHGQTVLHRPERGLSIQLGDAARLARATGVPVIAALRQADLAAGGQGAPLVPVYHAALAERIGMARPAAFLNVGGVANVSWIGRDGRIIGFDTGPGNGLIDLMLQQRGLGRYDEGGRLAAAGRPDPAALARMLDNPFFARAAPKSLDRYDFSLDAVSTLPPEDAAATLVAFTAAAVARALEHLPEAPTRWIVCGGGRHNPVMMQALSDAAGPCVSADQVGLRGDFIEAEAMAYCAARHARGLATTFPETTGARHPVSGGIRFDP